MSQIRRRKGTAALGSGFKRSGSQFSMKILQSIGLIAGSIAVMMVIGLLACVVLWLALFGLFTYSRLSGGTAIFSAWSWPQFLATAGFGAGIGYGFLLLTAGF